VAPSGFWPLPLVFGPHCCYILATGLFWIQVYQQFISFEQQNTPTGHPKSPFANSFQCHLTQLSLKATEGALQVIISIYISLNNLYAATGPQFRKLFKASNK